jgi:hypothetical protein
MVARGLRSSVGLKSSARHVPVLAVLIGACGLGGPAPVANAQWTVTVLTPASASEAYGTSVFGAQQGGFVTVAGFRFASVWSGTAGSWVNLNPPGATGSEIAQIRTQQVGQATVNGVGVASLWNGTATSWVNLNPTGSVGSFARAISGGLQAGNATINGRNRAGFWRGTAESWTELTVPGATNSNAFGVQSPSEFVGSATVQDVVRASYWKFDPELTWTDLNPAQSTNSVAIGIFNEPQAGAGTQQVGFAVVDGIARASLWRGTASSWVDLNPPDSSGSQAIATDGVRQVGAFVDASTGLSRACMWTGTAASCVDLTAFLTELYGNTGASGISKSGSIVSIVGSGFNVSRGRFEALLWKLNTCEADCDNSGALSPADFTCFLAKYRAGDLSADCDGSGALSPADFTCFLSKYRAGCPN